MAIVVVPRTPFFFRKKGMGRERGGNGAGPSPAFSTFFQKKRQKCRVGFPPADLVSVILEAKICAF